MIKKINDFGYILPSSCFAEQFSMLTSAFTNKCDMDIFQFFRWNKKQKMKTQESKEIKLEKK